MRQTPYSYVYVIGAACPKTGQAEAIIAPYLDTTIINQLLEQFSRALAPDVHTLLVWDGAGYHRANALIVPDNVTLVSLLDYSPEFNPIENLWHYLKSHYWSNRVHEDYDALFIAAELA